jgi:hypothetical protein
MPGRVIPLVSSRLALLCPHRRYRAARSVRLIANKMASDLAGQRPSKSPSFTPATNSCHSL